MKRLQLVGKHFSFVLDAKIDQSFSQIFCNKLKLFENHVFEILQRMSRGREFFFPENRSLNGLNHLKFYEERNGVMSNCRSLLALNWNSILKIPISSLKLKILFSPQFLRKPTKNSDILILIQYDQLTQFSMFITFQLQGKISKCVQSCNGKIIHFSPI